MTTTIHEAARALLRYFDSGNSVPVERATIRTDSVEVQALRAALAADEERVSVPREPTDAMICAGWDVEELQTPKRVWAAMLAAAEKEPRP
jgi:hypothetical protein